MSTQDEGLTWFVQGGTVGVDGDLTIPADVREQADLEPGDVIDARVIPTKEDGDVFVCLDLILTKNNTVTIPKYKRKVYGLNTGETVHADIKPTGRHVRL